MLSICIALYNGIPYILCTLYANPDIHSYTENDEIWFTLVSIKNSNNEFCILSYDVSYPKCPIS